MTHCSSKELQEKSCGSLHFTRSYDTLLVVFIMHTGNRFGRGYMRVSDPITIRNKTIKNRLTMAPTVKFDYAGADGDLSVTDEILGGNI